MKLAHQVLLGFSVVISLSIVDSYANYLLSRKVKHNIEFLSHSETVIRNSTRLHKTIIEMQSGFRGFLLTGEKSFLEPYYKGEDQVERLFREQILLMDNNPVSIAKIDTIHRLHLAWVDYADSLIKAKEEVLSASVTSNYQRLFESTLLKQVGKKLNDEIAIRFQEFDVNEYRVREERKNQLVRSIAYTHQLSLTFIILTFIVGLIASVLLLWNILRRIKSMVKLAEEISRGYFNTVTDTRHDELTSLSSSLNTMSLRLKRNIEELERKNTELDQFAYVVSHDLKAPVRGISNIVLWINEDMGDELSPKLKEYLNVIPERAKRMEDLINGLLDYARLSEKNAPEKVDVGKLVQEITDSIVPRHFHIETHGLPEMMTERIKLGQVLTNLISNAVKYTDREDAMIRIHCKELAAEYHFTVSDNGIGIEEEYHEKVFEIFQTLRKKNAKESTGIGLAIAKKIIEDHNGTITIKSKEGHGAEFIFTWPVLTS